MKNAFLSLLSVVTVSGSAHAQSDETRYYSYTLNSHPTVVDVTLESRHYQIDEQIAQSMGFVPLSTTWGADTYRPVAFLVWDSKFDSANTQLFLRTLMHEKVKLMRVCNLSNSDYNRLAAMAFGIYGAESKFGASWKFQFKERAQFLVSAVKKFEGREDDDGINSRGGTQIKLIPQAIQKAYPFMTRDNLKDISNSAVATVGFLAETLQNLRDRRTHQIKYGVKPGHVNLAYINNETIYDYIPYVYSGQMGKILNGPHGKDGAGVIDNVYVAKIRHNVQALSVWEYER